jgi:hypothetical protein
MLGLGELRFIAGVGGALAALVAMFLVLLERSATSFFRA